MSKKLLLLLLLPVLGCATSRIEKVIKKTDPKVAKVGLVLVDGRQGICSGAFIDETGNVLTCAHCLNHNTAKIFVKTEDQDVYRASVVKIDVDQDLALLHLEYGEMTLTPKWHLRLDIPKSKKFPYLKLGEQVKRGQQVLSFGSPLGIQGTVSVGYVQNLVLRDQLFVFHSASINPGNSGGPLVDLSGRLVGINKGHMMSGPFSLTDSLCVAISINDIRTFLNNLRSTK